MGNKYSFSLLRCKHIVSIIICYQNRPLHVVEASRIADAMDTADASTKIKGPAAKRRRTFDASDRTIAPYKRKPSLSKFDFEIYSNDPPPSLENLF